MKAALILLSLFFLMVTFRAQAETLDVTDVMYAEEKINSLLETKEHLVSQIDTRELAISEYLSYGIYKESCHNLSNYYLKIKSDSTHYLDRNTQLSRHFTSCAQGVDGLAFLYSRQKTH